MKPTLLLLALLGLTPVAWSQGNNFSLNVVGYYNLLLQTGDNLVANQFRTPNDSINNDQQQFWNLPSGSTFTKWDATTQSFLPLSVFDSASHTWSIDYTLSLGEGARVHTPGLGTNMFLGELAQDIWPVDSPISSFNWHPNYGQGLHLVSCPVPLGGATFELVIGRAPQDGEWVMTLDPVTQQYSGNVYHTGLGWQNGTPTFAVGQAAWFNLGPTPMNVPEPSVLELTVLALVSCVLWRYASSVTTTKGEADRIMRGSIFLNRF